MIINNISSTSFNGLWQYVGTLKKETGVYYKNKGMYTVYKFIYHPFKCESAEAIKNQTDKYFYGRNFSVWDCFDNHYKADLYQMNYVKIGEPIKESMQKELLERGYTADFKGGILDDEAFITTYSNDAYSPFDIVKMSKEKVEKIMAEHFDLNM